MTSLNIKKIKKIKSNENLILITLPYILGISFIFIGAISYINNNKNSSYQYETNISLSNDNIININIFKYIRTMMLGFFYIFISIINKIILL